MLQHIIIRYSIHIYICSHMRPTRPIQSYIYFYLEINRINIPITKEKMSQLESRRKVVQNYLLKYQNLPNSKGRLPIFKANLIQDELHQYAANIPHENRRRSEQCCNGRGSAHKYKDGYISFLHHIIHRLY